MWATRQGAVTGGCPAVCQQGGSASSRAGMVQTRAEPRETACLEIELPGAGMSGRRK